MIRLIYLVRHRATGATTKHATTFLSAEEALDLLVAWNFRDSWEYIPVGLTAPAADARPWPHLEELGQS